MRSALLTIGACFGLGLGLTATVPTANACSCTSAHSVQLDTIEGGADPTDEQARWPQWGNASVDDAEIELSLHDSGGPDAVPDVHLILKEVQ